MDLIRRAIALKPDFSEAYNSLGIVLKGAGRLDEAIAAYRKAIALQPAHPRGVQQSRQCAVGPGATGRRHRRLSQAIALKPDYADALGNLGSAVGKGQLDEAIAA